MRLAPLVFALLLSTTSAHAAEPLTLAQTMADPDWIGPPVEDAWWRWDGQAAQYTLKRNGATSVLEVGCGDGNNLALIKEALPGIRVAGVDISDGRIAFAQKYHTEHGNDVELGVGNATALPFKDNEFDVVYSLYCLEHLPVEFPKAVREMLRVASKKAIMIEPIAEYFGPLQRLFVFANDYIRGVPQFLEKEGVDVESVELLSSAANWMNLGAMITMRP